MTYTKKNVRQIYFVITFRSHPLLSQKLIEIKTITSAAEYIEVGRKDLTTNYPICISINFFQMELEILCV